MFTARILLMITVVASAYSCAGAQQSFPYHDEVRYKAGDETGRVQITLENTTLKRGKLAAVEYTFLNTNGSYWVYNWNFSRLIPLPGQLAIYDSEKHYIGDLIEWVFGSRKGVGNDDWLFLYGPCHIGRWIDFRVGYVGMQNSLPPGNYSIQLILYKAFFSINPSTILGDNKPKWYDTAEAARSNVLAIQIVD